MIPPYFPLDDKPHQLRMGFATVAGNEWLERDDHFDADIARKKQLLADHPGAVFQAQPGTDDGQQAALDLIANTLNRALKPSDQPPLLQAALLVQEDLALIQKKGGEYQFTAGCVCAPSGWNLKDRIGHGMDMVHEPVPGYEAELKKSLDSFFANVGPSKKFIRFNWGLFDSDRLFQPQWWRQEREILPQINSGNVGEALWFRVEKQSLQRLPGQDDILFTIRVFNTSLEDATDDPSKAERLKNAVQTMSGATRSYKSITRFETPLLDYLTARSA